MAHAESQRGAAASQQGINMNDPAAVEAWMADRVSTRADVLKTIRAYHAPEHYNVVAQAEQAT